jgi:hypothetical protein
MPEAAPARVRVGPDGGLHAVAARGTLMGNRGCLHDAAGQVVRQATGYRGWVCCRLAFRDRRRRLRQPGRYTELFFLDEATALAAGHRPCGECRRADHRAFRAALGGMPVREVDARLHAERRPPGAGRAGPPVRPRDLPDGAMVWAEAAPWLLLEGRLLAWTHHGYGRWMPAGSVREAALLTPPTMVEALRSGYTPALHHTASPTGKVPA